MKKQQDKGDENEDAHVEVIEIATGRTLTGEEAPMMSQLSAFLESHPGWEPIESESDKEADEENEDKEGKNEAGSSEEEINETIQKAKVEDDEYKTEEHTYYNIAHTVHEIITEQASIMVNGKLKEYQIKV